MSIKDELSESRRRAIASPKSVIHKDIEVFAHEIVHHLNDCFIKMHNTNPTEKVLTIFIRASKDFAEVIKASPHIDQNSTFCEVIYSLPSHCMFSLQGVWGKVISIGINSGNFKGFFLGCTLNKDYRVYKFIMTLDD